jgi:hypothetical protein
LATALGFQAVDLKEVDAAEWKEHVSTARCGRCGGLMVIEPHASIFSHLDAEGKVLIGCWMYREGAKLVATGCLK